MSKPTKRCSSLDRDLACPGAATLAAIVAPRSGDEGNEGTALHWVAHHRMITELRASGSVGLQPAMPKSLGMSQWIADYYFRTVQETIPADWSLEVEVALAYEFERFNLSGHIDCLGISPDGKEARFLDLKTGYDPVDIAEENEQVFGYACLLLRAYPELERIAAYIVQPRNDEDEGYPRVSPPMLLDGERIRKALPVFESRINDSLDRPMELCTGKGCKWCIGVSCPAIRAEADQMRMTMTPEVLAAIKHTPDDATLGDFLVSAKTLDKPIEDARAMAKERLAENGAIVSGSGVTITQKVTKGAYKVVRPVDLWNTLRELLSEEGRALAAKWSMTALKDKIAEEMHIPKTGKAAVTAESIFDARIRGHVEQGERVLFQYN